MMCKIVTIKDAIENHKPLYMYEVNCWKRMYKDLKMSKDALNDILSHPCIRYFKVCRVEDKCCTYIPTTQDYNDMFPNDYYIINIDKSFSRITKTTTPITHDGMLYFVSTRKSTPNALLTKVELCEGFPFGKHNDWFYVD